MADTEKAPQPQPQQQQQQQDQASQPQPAKAAKQKQVIAEKVSGTVKWFNVKSGYGFINRNDTKEDVFVHQTAIARNNPRKAVRSVGDGEAVEFAVLTNAAASPANTTPVKAADAAVRALHAGEAWDVAGPWPSRGGAQGDEGQEGGRHHSEATSGATSAAGDVEVVQGP
ncbi:unnamed protein product [Parnassius apollo]|uniref:(apollo) hypothetical protein n=1 Tax=Parnassius apollo TaxID=110799 RepID=A0A8S3X848_PARAO|nr:unnamed protein product [Parnassius apollo]